MGVDFLYKDSQTSASQIVVNSKQVACLNELVRRKGKWIVRRQ